MNKEFLTFDELPIGSWWAIADGSSQFGYCVLDKDTQTQDAILLSTTGERRTLDYFKLQYRYKRVVPNA